VDGNGKVTAGSLVASRAGEFETSVGTIVLRRLPLAEVFALRGAVTDLASMGADGEAARLGPEQVAEKMAALGRVIIAGVKEPVLTDNPEDGPTPADFPLDDQIAIFNAVLARAGLSVEEGRKLRPL
jgi:hypothetical protein